MHTLGIDIAQITDLVTQVANAGSFCAFDRLGDELFETVIGIAVLVHSQHPGGGGAARS